MLKSDIHPTEVPGGFSLSHVYDKSKCDKWIQHTESLGYDNQTHEGYQDSKIDNKERLYRRNDRCVIRVDKADVDDLWQKLEPHVPPTIEYGDYGTWVASGLNEMWRFYKYQPGQEFPVHLDNTTVKTSTYISWFTVLVYLTEGFEGGGTAFYRKSMYGPVMESGPVVTVTPTIGSVVVFYHTGHKSPFHAGLPVVGSEGCKYVIRTDVMYEAIRPSTIHLQVSAPYDKKGCEYFSVLTNEMVKVDPQEDD
eukprot:PhF_6_TR15408/c0_g2_i1/m.23882